MYVSTRAIVLRSVRYADADLIVKCYTQSDGLKSYFLRGVLKAKKGKLSAALFQTFTQLEITARHKNKGTLEYIKEAKLWTNSHSIQSTVQKSAVVIFLAEVLQNAIQEEERNDELFHFLTQSIQWLETHDGFANFHLFFLVRLSKYLGIYPHSPTGNEACFNLMEGRFETQKSDQYSVEGEKVALLKKLMALSADEIHTLKLNKLARTEFLNFILAYFEVQLQGFGHPKSLEVFNQLF